MSERSYNVHQIEQSSAVDDATSECQSAEDFVVLDCNQLKAAEVNTFSYFQGEDNAGFVNAEVEIANDLSFVSYRSGINARDDKWNRGVRSAEIMMDVKEDDAHDGQVDDARDDQVDDAHDGQVDDSGSRSLFYFCLALFLVFVVAPVAVILIYLLRVV